ncbi:hypothetical protein EVAR_23590_1 [Eumeta japonica]|uniref:Uncharacterized protein n=1 Tax=Eumeta variegata TaxID=151549 RepID=A0A4C1WXQ7_EUMVA|nr:hypothetical protein EVAR_23590_1 [Eumeta japonica]
MNTSQALRVDNAPIHIRHTCTKSPSPHAAVFQKRMPFSSLLRTITTHHTLHRIIKKLTVDQTSNGHNDTAAAGGRRKHSTDATVPLVHRPR